MSLNKINNWFNCFPNTVKVKHVPFFSTISLLIFAHNKAYSNHFAPNVLAREMIQ